MRETPAPLRSQARSRSVSPSPASLGIVLGRRRNRAGGVPKWPRQPANSRGGRPGWSGLSASEHENELHTCLPAILRSQRNPTNLIGVGGHGFYNVSQLPDG